MSTIYDVAKRANVSAMTVSRVINQKGNIGEATRKRVEKAIEELNYFPNKSARSLTSKATNILSLLITDINNPFFTKVARGAEDKALQLGYQVILSNSDENIEKESRYIQMLLESQVDGILIAPSGDESKNNIRTLIKHKIPFVQLDREVEGIESDVILGDSQKGTRMLIDHLINQGHKRIALINGPSYISTARERRNAYMEALKYSGIPMEEHLMFETDYIQKDGLELVDYLVSLPKGKRPTAVFAANNFIAVRVIKALRKKGIRVPEDIACVCFDDFDQDIDLDPFLTVAAQPAYDFGFMGVQMLVDKIEGNMADKKRKIILPPEIIVRKSSLATTNDLATH
ncbi:LacI family DNA-binding transcriptional regulator [Evansella sp. AB-rgal1]|uniref:LacI family DNA-binding transcriptional regulator n=1 Tax=Evansella sp. AB-rgal1 TaxID=3242696 RepID=UPI00359D4240